MDNVILNIHRYRISSIYYLMMNIADNYFPIFGNIDFSLNQSEMMYIQSVLISNKYMTTNHNVTLQLPRVLKVLHERRLNDKD